MVELEVGSRFSSFKEFDDFRGIYEAENFMQLTIFDSRTIAGARKRGIRRNIQERLKYYYVEFRCVHGGKYNSRSRGERPNQGTMKNECPFMIKLHVSEDGDYLEVVKMDGNHNHVCSETVDVCSSFFHLGDRFSSFKKIQDAVRKVENKTGAKYRLCEAKKIETPEVELDSSMNQNLVYRHLKYACVQGKRKPSIRVSRGNRVRVCINTSTLRNGCQAHIKFGISLDKQYLEVKSCSDEHNHEISKIRARTKVRQILAKEGSLDISLRQIKDQNSSLSTGQVHGTKCLVAFPEPSADGKNRGGIVILPDRCPNERISTPERFLNENLFTIPGDIPEINAEEQVTETPEETVNKMLLIRSRADKAVEDLVKEKKRSNDLKEKLLEESRKRNQYLEALLKIKCLKYNQTFEELIHG